MLEIRLSGEGTLQEQVVRAIRTSILQGHVESEVRLPSTRALAKALGVSRITTLVAYEQLVAEGLLYTQSGRGTFVAPLELGPRELLGSKIKPTLLRPVSRLGQRAKKIRLKGRRASFKSSNREVIDLRQSKTLTDERTDREWRRTLKRCVSEQDRHYPNPAGDTNLRASICNLMKRWHGVTCSPDQVLITSGAQQGIALLSQALLDRGDRITLENPGYASARYLFNLQGMDIDYLAVDSAGAVVNQLSRTKPPKLIYLTPAHQFPLGAVLSYQRRIELLEFAHKHRCWILEDDYDGQYRYLGSPVPSLKLLDQHESVVHIGTFSKTFDPSLRIGFVILPSALIETMRLVKGLQDQGSPSLMQTALCAFIESGGYERHIVRARKTLEARREALLHQLDVYFNGSVKVHGTETGSYFLVEFRVSNKHTASVMNQLEANGVLVQSAAPYFKHAPKRLMLMVGYGGLRGEHIEPAVRAIARVLSGLGTR